MGNKKCPFCKQKVQFIFPYLMYLEERKTWNFHHGCNNDLSILISADTKEGVIEKWNERAEDE